MQLSEHFTVEEFTESDTATRQGIDNSLPATLLPAAQATCQMLERIRECLSSIAGRPIPIIVTSGYRSAVLNAAVGSGPGSDHPRALAADFKAPAFGTPREICDALADRVDDLGIGQLIHEFGRWVHVSTRTPANAVNRIITITARGTEVGIQEA